MAQQNNDRSSSDSREEIAALNQFCGTLRNARIVEPLSYWSTAGKQLKIPVGPCLVEQVSGAQAEIIWGTSGQNSTAMAQNDVDLARKRGALLMLD